MNNQLVVASLLAAFSLTVSYAQETEIGSAQEAEFGSDQDQLSYTLGILIGERGLNVYPDLNYDLLFEALRAQHGGGETRMSIADAAEWLKNYQMEIAAVKAVQTREAGEKYLADNAQRAEVAVTNSGLQYEILTPTEGPKPQATDTVRVHYRGTSIDGTEFDSSYSRNAPASFPLNRVIPGWTEGLQLMAVGSKFRFVIPSGLAYGERGSGRSIGPGETLIFIVELLDINPA